MKILKIILTAGLSNLMLALILAFPIMWFFNYILGNLLKITYVQAVSLYLLIQLLRSNIKFNLKL